MPCVAQTLLKYRVCAINSKNFVKKEVCAIILPSSGIFWSAKIAVAIGKIGSSKVDFIASSADDKKYIQVTESMLGEEVRRRELAPLKSIQDNYEKLVLSLEPGLDSSYDGIKSINLLDWLLEE